MAEVSGLVTLSVRDRRSIGRPLAFRRAELGLVTVIFGPSFDGREPLGGAYSGFGAIPLRQSRRDIAFLASREAAYVTGVKMSAGDGFDLRIAS